MFKNKLLIVLAIIACLTWACSSSSSSSYSSRIIQIGEKEDSTVSMGENTAGNEYTLSIAAGDGYFVDPQSGVALGDTIKVTADANGNISYTIVAEDEGLLKVKLELPHDTLDYLSEYSFKNYLVNTPTVTSTYMVQYRGPGGHSNGNYGRVNALHAAARALVNLAENYDETRFTVDTFFGGESVNAIAGDGYFEISFTGNADEFDRFDTVLLASLYVGRDAENAFREQTDLTSLNAVRFEPVTFK